MSKAMLLGMLSPSGAYKPYLIIVQGKKFVHALIFDTSTEFIDTVRHAQHGCNPPRYCSDKAPDIRLGSAQRHLDMRGRGGHADAMEREEVFCDDCCVLFVPR